MTLNKELDPSILFILPPRIIRYPYGEKYVLSIHFPRYDDSIVLVKSERRAYKLRDNKPIAASSATIMQMAVERVKRECLTHLESNRSLKNKITSEIKGIEDSVIVYPILRKIIRDGIPLHYITQDQFVVSPSDLTAKLKEKTLRYPNGNPTGAIVILENAVPRYEYTCLRYSAPTYRIKNISRTKKEREIIKGCMVLCGGAVHIITHSVRKIVSCSKTGEPVLIAKVASSLKKNWPVEYIAAFLKSSPFLWYIWEKCGEFNLVKRQIFLDLKIPFLGNETQLSIVTLVQELCEREKDYLREVNGLQREQLKKLAEKQRSELHDKIERLTNNCNDEINKISQKINKILYEKLNINEEEQGIILSTLKRLGLYVTESKTEK